jgi:hypothetical protein
MYRLAQDAELEMGNHDCDPLMVYALEMVSCLCRRDLTNARFLWKRIESSRDQKTNQPRKISEHPKMKALWKIGDAMNKKDFVNTYQTVNAAIDTFGPGDLVTPWLRCLAAEQRAYSQNLIARSYASLSLSSAAQLLGLDEKAAESHVVQLGWTVQQGIVTPKPQARTPAPQADVALLSHMVTLVSQLEAPIVSQVIDRVPEQPAAGGASAHQA